VQCCSRVLRTTSAFLKCAMIRHAYKRLARAVQPYARALTTAGEAVDSSVPALSTAQLALRKQVYKLGKEGQWQDVS
jgi:hypothetical protein